MRLLQINTNANSGSTGRIAEKIGQNVINNGGRSAIIYGRLANKSTSQLYKIGSKAEQALHLIKTRLFDTHGFHSKRATFELIEFAKNYDPDIIHLHNIHGYYLHVEYLFRFLKEISKPVVWTLHDCWPFTGHCCHFARVDCKKWVKGCYQCPLSYLYPKSYYDNSKNNYLNKKNNFLGVTNLQIVTVSDWLKAQVNQSFLKEYSTQTIYNGIDTKTFKINNYDSFKKIIGVENKKVILGVANEWSDSKGLNIFLNLSKYLSENEVIVLVGLTLSQIKKLPLNIIGINKTSSVDELVAFYNIADVFVTPSIAETFGLVVAEALACGVPCVVNNTSALPELINERNGIIVEENEARSYYSAIKRILRLGKHKFQKSCRHMVIDNFRLENQNNQYYQLYKSMIDH